MTNAERLLKTKYAVFFEREEAGRDQILSWNIYHFGFETEEDALICYGVLLMATNHESQDPRGFRNVRLCHKKTGTNVWYDMQ